MLVHISCAHVHDTYLSCVLILITQLHEVIKSALHEATRTRKEEIPKREGPRERKGAIGG